MPRTVKPCHVLAAVFYFSGLRTFGRNLERLHKSVYEAQIVCHQLNCFVFRHRRSLYHSTLLAKTFSVLLAQKIVRRYNGRYNFRYAIVRRRHIQENILRRFSEEQQETLKGAGEVLREGIRQGNKKALTVSNS